MGIIKNCFHGFLAILLFFIPRFVTEKAACKLVINYGQDGNLSYEVAPVCPFREVTEDDDWNCSAQISGLIFLGYIVRPKILTIPIMRDGTPAWSEADESAQ